MKADSRIYTLVLKIGGGAMLDGGPIIEGRVISRERLCELVDACVTVQSYVDRLLIVVGGPGAHLFIGVARERGASEAECDELGVSVSEMASKLIVFALRRHLVELYPRAVQSLEEAEVALCTHRVVVVGPLQNGTTSSDSVAAFVAEHFRADALFIVKRWGLADRVPTTETPGSVLKSVKLKQLMSIVSELPERAGNRPILDFNCLRIVQRSHFRSFIVDFEEFRRSAGCLIGPADIRGVEIVNDLASVWSLADSQKNAVLWKAKRLMSELSDPFHDWRHVERCMCQGETLAKIYRYSDAEVVFLATALHDVERIHGEQDHEARGAEWAQNYLKQLGFQEALCTKVAGAIELHRWTMMPCGLEGKIVRDADKLDALSLDRWMTWDRLSSSGNALDFGVIEKIAGIARRLECLLSLQRSLSICATWKAELLKATSSFQSRELAHYGLIASSITNI